MKNVCFKKGLVCGILILFISISTMPMVRSISIEKHVSTENSYSVDLSCDDPYQDIKQGKIALFTVEITNTGTLDDTYDVIAGSIEDIVCKVNGVNADQFDPYPISLLAGESITFEVTAEVWESVPVGEWPVIVDAYSQNDTNINEELILYLNVNKKSKPVSFIQQTQIELMSPDKLNEKYRTNSVKNTENNIPNNIPRILINDGSLLGYVTDKSGNPLEGALVRVYFHESNEEDYSNCTGYYHVTNIPICYCMKNATCSKEGYKTEWFLLSIVENTTHDFILTTTNNPPNKPEVCGPTHLQVGVDYDFTFVSTDPDGDNIANYTIDWGDENIDVVEGPFASGEEVITSHTWNEAGDYLFRCKANDIYGAESDWFEYWIKVGKKNKITTNPFLFYFVEQFPLLERVLLYLLK